LRAWWPLPVSRLVTGLIWPRHGATFKLAVPAFTAQVLWSPVDGLNGAADAVIGTAPAQHTCHAAV